MRHPRLNHLARFLLRWSLASWAALGGLLPFSCGLVLVFQLIGLAPLRSILPAPHETPGILEQWLLTPLLLALLGAFYGAALGQMQRGALRDCFGWQPARWRRGSALGGALGALSAHLLLLGLEVSELRGWNLSTLPILFGGIGWGQQRAGRLNRHWIATSAAGGLACAILLFLAQFTGLPGLFLVGLAPAAPAFVTGPALAQMMQNAGLHGDASE